MCMCVHSWGQSAESNYTVTQITGMGGRCSSYRAITNSWKFSCLHLKRVWALTNVGSFWIFNFVQSQNTNNSWILSYFLFSPLRGVKGLAKYAWLKKDNLFLSLKWRALSRSALLRTGQQFLRAPWNLKNLSPKEHWNMPSYKQTKTRRATETEYKCAECTIIHQKPIQRTCTYNFWVSSSSPRKYNI